MLTSELLLLRITTYMKNVKKVNSDGIYTIDYQIQKLYLSHTDIEQLNPGKK